jgi:hypothetical protein
MKLSRAALAVLVPLTLAALPAGAHARRAWVEPPDTHPQADAAEAVGPGGQSALAGAPVMIRPPHPPPVLTTAQVRATLERARVDLAGCLPPTLRPSRAVLRATFSRRGGLSLRVQVTPRDPAVVRCLDTAARRWLVPLEARPIGATVTATIQVRGGGPPQPPPPPIQPPPPSNGYDEGLVHASLDARRAAILRCLPASTTTPGDITLRLTVQTNGSLQLEGATLPAGVGGGPVLVCLSGIVASTRVPSPPTPRAVVHIVTLGS